MSEPLAHRHYDMFELPEAPDRLLGLLGYRLPVSFCTDREGNIASLAAAFEPLVRDIVFTRIPAGDCRHVQPWRHDRICRAGQRWTTDADAWEPTNLQTPSLPKPNLMSLRASGWSSIWARTGKWMNCSSISRMERSRRGEGSLPAPARRECPNLVVEWADGFWSRVMPVERRTLTSAALSKMAKRR